MINNIRFSQVSGGNGSKLLSMGPGPEGVFFNGPITEGVVDLGFSGTSKTFSLNDGTVFKCILAADCTFTMPSVTAGRSFTLFLTQNGAYTATFSGVSWSGGVAPTITTGNGKKDILVFVSDGTCWYGNYVQNYSCTVTPTSSSSSSNSSSSSDSSSSSSSEVLPLTIYTCASTGFVDIDNGAWTLSNTDQKINHKQYYTLDSNSDIKIYWSSALNLWIVSSDSTIQSSTTNILGVWNNTTTSGTFSVQDSPCPT